MINIHLRACCCKKSNLKCVHLYFENTISYKPTIKLECECTIWHLTVMFVNKLFVYPNTQINYITFIINYVGF